jgi:hypothetical protein
MRNRQANIRNSTCIASIAIIIVGILWEKLREKMKNGKLLILAILLPKQPKVTEDKSPTVCTRTGAHHHREQNGRNLNSTDPPEEECLRCRQKAWLPPEKRREPPEQLCTQKLPTELNDSARPQRTSGTL